MPYNKSCQQRTSTFNINSIVTRDKKEISKGFNKFFPRVTSKLRAALPPCAHQDVNGIRHKVNTQNERFPFKPARKSKVPKVLMSLKRSKHPGIGNIPPGTGENASKVIIEPLLHIKNLSSAMRW